MSDREEQLKRDIRDLQAKLAQAVRPRDKIVKVPVEVIRYVDKIVKVPVEVIRYVDKIVKVPVEAIRYVDKIVKVPVEVIRYVDKIVKVDRVKEVNFMVEVIKTNTVDRPCKIQAARIAELESQLSIMERECQAL
jgi:hypothetical protein